VRSERGASAVEFAIIISLLFVVLFGIIQFGIAYNRYQGLQAAAREGARVASVNDTPANVAARVRAAQSLFDPSKIQVKIEYWDSVNSVWATPPICDDSVSGSGCTSTTTAVCTSAGGAGNLVRVTATVPKTYNQYAITIPLWGSAHITYSAQGVFRCE
jgi:Flp pilus assembly protein TadG